MGSYLNGIKIPEFSKLSAISSLSPGPQHLFAILVVICVLLLGLSLGRTRALISLLAIYIAFALQAMFPFFGNVQEYTKSFTSDLNLLRAAVFLALYCIIFGVLNKTVLRHRFTMGESSFVSILIMSLLQLSLVVSIIFNIVPAYIQSKTPSFIWPYLTGQIPLFAWAVAPILLLLFIGRDSRR
ncbi:hypothetical protein KW791_03185 [Candidatus Parcubacteria bacterium]|nr:hypothetical protein [Candidatus Parcubacteria bacterium]